MLAPWKENYDKSRQSVKKQRRYFADKMLIVKAMVFPVVMSECEIRRLSIEELMLSNCSAEEDT